MQDSEWKSVFQMKAESLPDMWMLDMDDSIQPENPEPGFYKYIRGSFAQFRCSGCGRSWPSKRVPVVFHFKRDATGGRGSVKVRLCKQECRRCSARKNEKPTFSRDNIDVIVEKLIEKINCKCYGINIPKPVRYSQFQGTVNGPHENAHCEACKLGICQQGT